MKKKLMAMLVAAAMLVCMMPAMAFADEAPAEEQVVQATEEVVVPEAAEDEAVPEAVEEGDALLENEAVVEEADLEGIAYGGSWKGWVFTFTGDEVAAANITVDVNGQVIDYAIRVGANDFSSIADQYAANGYTDIVISLIANGWSVFKVGVPIKTKVVVDKAASKDTIFTYASDNVIAYTISEAGIFFEIKTAEELGLDQDLFGNTITLKAGQTTAEGYLYYGESDTAPEEADYYVGAILVTEKGNDGGYTTDSNIWVYNPTATMSGAKGNYARFASLTEVQALLDKINASEYKDGEALLIATFQNEEMTFTHTATAKGVQTGDSNSLGLWVVVLAVAGVAAAAVALKRRENFL